MILGICFVSIWWNLRLRSELEGVVLELSREREFHHRNSAELRQNLESIENHQRFLARFIRDLPDLTRELHSRVDARRLPGILLEVICRSLEPEQAVVLLCRRGSSNTGTNNNERRLVVAAAHPPDSPIRPGVDIPLRHGTLATVVRTQLTMTRYDFDRERSFGRRKNRDDELPGFEPELVAPMVSDDKTVGVVALSGTPYGPYEAADTKAALRVIAQLGARTFQSAAVYRETRFSADVDALTGAFNKRFVTQDLAERILEAREIHSELSVFLFDIDNFKNYNDVNGHVEGDALLRELAQLVSSEVRDEDIFGRFGGEEFLLILPDTSDAEALVVAEKMRASIAAHAFPFGERQPLGILSVSGGVAAYRIHAHDSTGLLRAADEALYLAKNRGRNRVLVAGRDYLGEDDKELAGTHSKPLRQDWGRVTKKWSQLFCRAKVQVWQDEQSGSYLYQETSSPDREPGFWRRPRRGLGCISRRRASSGRAQKDRARRKER